MGTIDTTIKGDVGSVSALATWLRGTLAIEVDAAIDQVYKARTNTEADWEGPAGEGFQARMSSGGKKAENVVEDAKTGFKIAEEWVRVTDRHKKRMEEVRQNAAKAGLTVTKEGIVDPGPALAKPTTPGDGATSDTYQQYGQAINAYRTQAQRVAAYQQAVKDVAAIRKDMNGFQHFTQNALDDLISKPHLQAVAFANDTMVAHWAQKKARKLDLRQKSINTRALNDARNNPHNGAWRGQRGDQARNLHRQSQWAKWAGRAGKGARVVSKVPMLGVPIAAGIAWWDIEHGKSPSKAIVSTVASTGVGMGVGAGVGALAGGAVGNVPGAIVGGAVGAVAGWGAGAFVDTLWDDHMPKKWEKNMDDGLKGMWEGSGAGKVYRKVTPW